jgi:hypothetical protein
MDKWNKRRGSARLPLVLDGLIARKDNRSPIKCVVRDVSRTGVRFSLPRPAEVPLEFTLRIPDHHAVASLRLVWSDGRDFGATFID